MSDRELPEPSMEVKDTVEIDGVQLKLSQPYVGEGEWIGQQEVLMQRMRLKQLLKMQHLKLMKVNKFQIK